MRRILLVLASLAIVSVAGETALSGQTVSSTLTVNATVTKNCTITTAAVAFGNYDPVGTNATAPLDGNGTLTVTCTKGAVATIGLGPGANAQGSTRRMLGGAAVYLTYELYQDSSHATIWGNAAGTMVQLPAAPDRNPRNISVYGRVAQAQDATVGAYTDSVVATVNF